MGEKIMKTPIALIITTFLRDELLKENVEHLLSLLPENITIFIGDQGKPSADKVLLYSDHSQIKYFTFPFDSGLSKSRNELVKEANKLGFKYCIIGSDSIFLNNTIDKIENIIEVMETGEYDLVGFNLESRIPWEANINLIEGRAFELDFLRRKNGIYNPWIKKYINDKFTIYTVELVKNFFIAKTQTLLDNPWDEELLLAEHERFFYEAKRNNVKVGWSDYITGNYKDFKPAEYKRYRDRLYKIFIPMLKQKYNIKGWLIYKNYH